MTDPRFAYSSTALAAIQEAASPGDRIVIHAEDCESEDESEACPCAPVVLVCVEAKRAKA